MTAPWRDIYSYLVSTPGNTFAGDLVTGKAQISDKYKDIVSLHHQTGGGEDVSESMPTDINIDWSKLPNNGMTKFGRIDRTSAAEDPNTPVGKDQQSTLNNRKLAYNDPNFGWITPLSNVKKSTYDKFNDILPYIIMTAASAGFGSLATVPLLASGAIEAAKYAGGRQGGGSNAPNVAVGPNAAVSPPSGPQGVRQSPQATASKFPYVRDMLMKRG